MTTAGSPSYHGRARWRKMAAHQLKIEPLCKLCAEKGKVVPARVADHVERHNGDQNKFWFGKLQSLCFDCHDRTKQQIEINGFAKGIGADGFPLDKAHPFYAK